MKLNKKGRKRGTQAKQANTSLGMGIELSEPKANNSNGDSSPKTTTAGGYRSKYAQPVVGSYGS